MSWGIDEERWSQGMSTERYHPWHGQALRDDPVPGVEGVAGGLAIISLHGDHGVTYEHTSPLGDQHFRHTASAPVPDLVRPA